jgi:tRNA 5-methylaminomethyl-2-thiouridine biosynthesis bifunctional protein
MAVMEQTPSATDTWLHFVSVEKHPLSKEDLTQVLALWPSLQDYAQLLLHNIRL